MSEYIEVNGNTLRLRDDGRVDVYSPAGYRILELSDLIPSVRDLLMEKSREEKKS